MKIVQLLPTLSYGDAVGNDVLAINALLLNLGIETKIYATDIDKRLPSGIAESFYKMPNVKKDDIVIYHLSIGCKAIRDYLLKQDCRKVMIYHNITPSRFFVPYSIIHVRAVRSGLWDLKILRKSFEACIAVSEFNKQDLRKAGYTCPIAVLPILIQFKDYEQEPDLQLISHYKNDGWKNILFVGRIAPNKCQEDVILSFAVYKKLYNSKARLFLVGNYGGIYYDHLQEYVKELGVTDVIFTGHIPFKSILAYYHLADVFLCMSEHEGFCVPLLEAMKFDVPIVAYSSTAIPYTLGDSGIIFSTKSPNLVAAILDEVLSNTKLREKILFEQRKRLKYFQFDNISELAKRIVIQLINHESIESDETQIKACNSNVEELFPGLKQKVDNHLVFEVEEASLFKSQDSCSYLKIPVNLRKNDMMFTGESRCSFVYNYYEQVYSQTGIKAVIKKLLFGNLLNVLMEQENYLKEMDNRIKEQEERIKEHEERIKEHEEYIEDLEESVYLLL